MTTDTNEEMQLRKQKETWKSVQVGKTLLENRCAIS